MNRDSRVLLVSSFHYSVRYGLLTMSILYFVIK